MVLSRLMFGWVLLLSISACGGGSDEPVEDVQYPLRTLYKNYVENSGEFSVTVSGSASSGDQTVQIGGSGSVSESLSIGTFEGETAFVKNITLTGDVRVDRISVPIYDYSRRFFASDYRPLGSSSSSSYCLVDGDFVIPEVAKVGDNGLMATFSCYTNESRLSKLSTIVQSYVIEAGSGGKAKLRVLEEFRLSGGRSVMGSVVFDISSDGQIERRSENMAFVQSSVVFNLIVNYD